MLHLPLFYSLLLFFIVLLQPLLRLLIFIYIYIYTFIYSTYFASLRRFIYYSLRVYSLLNFKYCLFCVYIYLCDFAKRCPLSQCSRNKTRGLAVLLGVN